MFAQILICVVLFIVFVVVVWKVLGKRIAEMLSTTGELNLEEEKTSLERRIEALRKVKIDLENAKEEIDVTQQLATFQKELEKCETRLRKLNEKMEETC